MSNLVISVGGRQAGQITHQSETLQQPPLVGTISDNNEVHTAKLYYYSGRALVNLLSSIDQ